MNVAENSRVSGYSNSKKRMNRYGSVVGGNHDIDSSSILDNMDAVNQSFDRNQAQRTGSISRILGKQQAEARVRARH